MSKSYNRYNNTHYVEKLRRLAEWSRGNQSAPFKISIIPTNRCNFRCFFCPNSVARNSGRFKREDELNKEEWLDIVDKGIELGVHEWRFLGGGEPLVRYDTTLSMIYRIKRKNQESNCEIITNGFLLEQDDIKKLVGLKMDRIIFSIHGSDKETQEYISGIGTAFERVTKNLLFFKKYKKLFKTDKPIIQINTVITNRNYDKIVDIVKYVKKVGCNELALHPMRVYDEIEPQVKHLVMNKNEEKIMLEGIKKSKKIAERYKNFKLDLDMVKEIYSIGNDIENADMENNNKENRIKNKFCKSRCFEPFYGLLICPKGGVSHCVPHGMGIENLNVRDKDLEEIWYGEYFKKIRNNITNDVMMDCCTKCGLLDMSRELREDLNLYLKENNLTGV